MPEYTTAVAAAAAAAEATAAAVAGHRRGGHGCWVEKNTTYSALAIRDQIRVSVRLDA